MTQQTTIDFNAGLIIDRVWSIIEQHEGRANRIRCKRIIELLDLPATEGSRRRVTDAVEVLRRIRGKRIGADKSVHGGYYVAVTLEDRLKFVAPYMRQAATQFETARIFLNEQEMAELRGQLGLEVGA